MTESLIAEKSKINATSAMATGQGERREEGTSMLCAAVCCVLCAVFDVLCAVC